MAGTALLAAACSGGASPGATGLTAFQQTTAYAQCMRADGEPGFPDLRDNGGFIVDGKKDHLDGSLMQSANKTCEHLLPNSAPLTATQQRQLTDQALKYVACMRSHGSPSFPDPTVSANGIEFRGSGGVNSSSVQFQTAMRACQKLLPGSPP